MPDKSLKNLKKLKGQAVEKKVEVKEWKHESPTEKKETHQHDNGEKTLLSDVK